MKLVETAPQAARVVDGDEYAVELALDPKDVLPRLLTAITATPQGRTFLRLVQCPFVDERQRAADLRRIAELPGVASAMRLLLAPSHAEDLGISLDRECGRPVTCLAAGCGN